MTATKILLKKYFKKLKKEDRFSIYPLNKLFTVVDGKLFPDELVLLIAHH